MNLWAKRIGQLAALPVALFFSCEDEANLLGYKNPNQKFNASYVEIPIESSVLLLDSQRTSNYIFENETNRLLIGQYDDDKLGPVSANAYTQYYTNTTAKLTTDAVYDSVSLQLRLDFYSYGSKDSTTSQTVSVYELDEVLQYTNRRYYFNTSQVLTKPSPLGTKSFTVNPVKMQEFIQDRTDTVLTVNVPLDAAFGQKLFSEAMDYATNPDDTTLITFNQFTEIFKGISIKSDNGDKIVGISPLSAIRVHYHKDTARASLEFPFVLVTNFNEIKTDFASGDLAGLTQSSQDFFPPSDLRYIQSGTGVYTKLDFSKFFEFCDTVPNVIITSAHLSIGSVVESDLSPPSNLVLRILQENNELKKVKNEKDTLDIGLYNPRFPAHTGTLSVDNGSVVESDLAMYVVGDQSPYLSYSSDKKSFDGNYALFFQQLSIARENLPRFRYFVLYPSSPAPNTKSVNRVVFPKDNIKLKVYYTKPTTPLN